MDEPIPENKPPVNKRIDAKVEVEKDVIPNMEMAIIAIFFASFIFWAISKCTVTQSKYEQAASKKEAEKAMDTVAIIPQAPPPTAAPVEKIKTVTKKITVLYVVVDGLKLRTGPHRDSSIVREFPIKEELQFLEEVTSFKEKINMGTYVAEEPWVKIRSTSGHEGWVYGAGVSYYRPPN